MTAIRSSSTNPSPSGSVRHFLSSAALLAGILGSSVSHAAVIAPLAQTFHPRPGILATIPAVPGQRIHIIEVGIGGDADFGSGPTQFTLLGGGIDFSWAAGQAVVVSADLQLPTTPVGAGSARGFSIATVDLTANVGEAVSLQWDFHNDFDGRFTVGTDTEGNTYDDSLISSSVRPYVRYELISTDHGDAPSSYGTQLADDGPSHETGALYLGSLVDGEADGLPDDDAVGDDLDGADDEDGVVFDTLLVGGAGAVTITASASGRVDLWIDLDGNGDFFDADDQILSGLELGAGSVVVPFVIPASATVGSTYSRVRLSSSGGLGPLGAAEDGEVEDYAVTLATTASLSLSAATIAENGGSLTLTVTLDKPAVDDITAHLRLRGNALNGTDYSLTPGVDILIPANSTTGTLTINALQDSVYDGGEIVRLSLSSLDGPAVKGSPYDVSASFVDDETAPVATLSASAATMGENGGSVTLTLNLSQPVSVDTTFPLAYDNVALRGTDYNASTSLVVLAGASSGTTLIGAIDDGTLEPTERFRARLLTNPGSVLGSPSSVTVDILDNDGTLPHASLSTGAATLAENGGTVSLTANLDAPAIATTTITLAYSGVATRGNDYSGATQIVIPSGATSASINLTGIDDALYEADTIKVKIQSATQSTFDPTLHTIAMTDDDTAQQVTLSFGAASMNETGGSVQLTATLDSPAVANTTILLKYSGSATTADYVRVRSMVIPSGDTSASVATNATTDSLDEPHEVIKVSVDTGSNAVPAAPGTVNLTIIDDD